MLRVQKLPRCLRRRRLSIGNLPKDPERRNTYGNTISSHASEELASSLFHLIIDRSTYIEQPREIEVNRYDLYVRNVTNRSDHQ